MIMKIFKAMMVAVVAMLGLVSCNNNSDWLDVDYSNELVGTWICFDTNYAEALVISQDGSAISTGVEDGELWENVKGNITVKNNKIIMSFEDDDNFEGRFDLVPGVSLSIFDPKTDQRLIYEYCSEDLSEEIEGMWVCTDGPLDANDDMAIQSYHKNGNALFTGLPPGSNVYKVNYLTDYKIVGDLMIRKISEDNDGSAKYLCAKLVYQPDATSLGDIINQIVYEQTEDGWIGSSTCWLRINQTLNLAGKKYDYSKTFVTNVQGADKEIEYMDYTFNFSKMDGIMLNKMLKAVLFTVEFPDTKTMRYNCHYNGESMTMDAPVAIEGNKVTLKMSQRDAALRDVDLYMFQDADDSQLHMYMHTYAFINFFGNMKIIMLSQAGKLDKTDAAAVKTEFDRVYDVVKSINVSLVFDAGK